MQLQSLYPLLLTSCIGMLSSTSTLASEAEVRSSKTIGVGARAGYFTGILGTGADIYYNLGGKLQVGATYNKGHLSDGPKGGGSEVDLVTGEHRDFDFESRATMDATQAGAFARYYLLDSFSVTGGLVHRTVDVSFSHIPSPFDTNESATSGSVTGRSLALLLQVGNRWSWQNGITVGADWIGYTLPVVDLGTSGSTDGMDALKFDGSDQYRQTAKGASTRPILQGLMVDIGYMF